MVRELSRADWLRAARLALLRGGPEAVRVEPLARALHVTKGSFYWHFTGRAQLLEMLLREWEQEMPELLRRVKGRSRDEALRLLVGRVVETAELSARGEAPSDAAVFAWASVAPGVARRVNSVEKHRISALRRIAGHPGRGELLYLIWLGFVARGQRVPKSRRRFPEIARMMLDVLLFPDFSAAALETKAPRPAGRGWRGKR